MTYGPVWQFGCDLNSLLFDYGPMEVSVTGADDPAFAVPYLHSLLKCG